MSANETNLLDSVVGNTQSELILFFVIIVVALVVVMLPLYTLMVKDRKQKNQLESIRQDKYIERERQIIQVITANTEVMAGLKSTLEASGVTTTSSFARVHERMDFQSTKLGELTSDTVQIKTVLDRSIHNQLEMQNDINKILLIVDNIPNTSSFSSKASGDK